MQNFVNPPQIHNFANLAPPQNQAAFQQMLKTSAHMNQAEISSPQRQPRLSVDSRVQSPVGSENKMSGMMTNIQTPQTPNPRGLVNMAYERASPLPLQNFVREKGFTNFPSIPTQSSFLDKLIKQHYNTPQGLTSEFGAYILDCKTQFKHAMGVIQTATATPVYRKEIIFPEIAPGRKTLILDLDETLIHSEIKKDTVKYDFIVVFPSLTTANETDVASRL